MKIYSELLDVLFNSVEECAAAEKEYERKELEKKQSAEKKSAERKARAEAVEAARIAVRDAEKEYAKLLEAFIADYGAYHWTTSNIDDVCPSLASIFSEIFQ